MRTLPHPVIRSRWKDRPLRLVVSAFAALLAVSAVNVEPVAARSDDHASVPGQIEGRPGPGQASPLQARVDAAAPGATVEVGSGAYDGDLWIDRPLRLIGRGRPVLRGSGGGSVVRVRAADVTLEGFDIDGRAGGDLGRDSSGIHVSAPRVHVRDCRIRQTLFGIYLREADDAVIESTEVTGIPGRDPGENGSGIHVWNSQRFRLTGNRER